MIQKLEHQRTTIAEGIREVFQASYAVEAKLLGASDFPPLKRPLEGFLESKKDFHGYVKDETLAGVVEVVPGKRSASLFVAAHVCRADHYRCRLSQERNSVRGDGGSRYSHVAW